MQLHEHESNPKVVTSKTLTGISTAAQRTAVSAVRIALTSKKTENILEGFFAVLSIIYFVAAATFAGVILGNAFGS
jgi:hypothetical protein